MHRFSVLLFTMALLGCAPSPVPFVLKGSTYDKGGYSDKKLAEGVYSVRFEGNGENTMSEVVEYVKRRAAEICGSSDFKAEIREFLRIRTEIPTKHGWIVGNHDPWPTAEAQVKCKVQP